MWTIEQSWVTVGKSEKTPSFYIEIIHLIKAACVNLTSRAGTEHLPLKYSAAQKHCVKL